MKLQCPCGAKYAFDIPPEMAREPVKFVCPSCGFDASDFVNEMVRKELSEQAAAGVKIDPVPAPRGRLRVSPANDPPAAPEPEPANSVAPQMCARHANQIAHEKCVVCGKPVCPKCMELFGYVCSPSCRTRASSHGIEVPVFAGQKSVVEARSWDRLKLVASICGALFALLFGVWIWYDFAGSRPRAIFSVSFPAKVHSGMSRLCGRDQIVFLRGGTLARYEIKTRREVWSRELIDRHKIEREVDAERKNLQAFIDKSNSENPDADVKMPRRDKMIEDATRAAEAALDLRVSGQNVWVMSPEKLAHFDWDSGKTLQEVPRAFGFGRAAASGGEVIFTGENDAGQPVITHLNLASGELKKETVGELVRPDSGANSPDAPGAGLPTGKNGGDAGAPLNPAEVAEQAQNLGVAERIALPATLANAAHQQAIEAAVKNDSKPKSAPAKPGHTSEEARFEFIPSEHGNVEFSAKLLEEKIVSRAAMKAAPKNSALNGDVNVTQSAEVANEILNDMQRSRGGDTVQEDQSRYQVTIRLPGANGTADWSGEVTGPPSVFPLQTVNVVAANQTIIVLDKSNKKLWETTLTHNVPRGLRALEEGESPYGQGPCVERDGTLYVADEAMLSAFDPDTGRARWRLPSVGIVGLRFDDKGMLYVNSTTASLDKLKYSRQIDIMDKSGPVILKIDPKKGNTLWTSQLNGFITHLDGRYIYCLASYDPGDEEENDNDLTAILRKPAYVQIRRLNPSNGKMMWEYSQPRAPLDVQFDGNSIEMVFKNEVQVLRFLSL